MRSLIKPTTQQKSGLGLSLVTTQFNDVITGLELLITWSKLIIPYAGDSVESKTLTWNDFILGRHQSIHDL